ncbi:MAG: hypothetical protein RLY31_1336 [Bacteroidota bacterium]|jgi:hypothetical protein
MTLRDLFELIGRHPAWVLSYFMLIPLASFLTGKAAAGEGGQPPWRYIYSGWVYMSCIPGVFALTLSAYVFVFERRSIFDTDVYMQLMPVLSMFVTLWLIRREVSLDEVPGFDKITGLVGMMAGIFAVLWILDKTRIWIVSYLPFWQGMLLFLGLLALVLWGWRQISARGGRG